MEKKIKMGQREVAGMGALAGAVATAGAAAVGYYFYASKDAAKHRKLANKWAKNFKEDVMKQARKAKQFDQKMLGSIITEAGKKYTAVKSIDAKELAKATKELKSNWKLLSAELQKGAKKTVKTVKKTATKSAKTVKSVVKKATKK